MSKTHESFDQLLRKFGLLKVPPAAPGDVAKLVVSTAEHFTGQKPTLMFGPSLSLSNLNIPQQASDVSKLRKLNRPPTPAPQTKAPPP